MRSKHMPGRLAASVRALSLLLMLPSLCQAGGFSLYEYGARAEAMGGANIALADDASAVAYNPAGMTQLPGTRVMFGATAIAPTADVRTGNEKTTTQTNIYLPPHAYLVQEINDKVWFGVGLFSRFGVGTQYGYDWAGRSKVYRAELSTYSLAPNLALKLTDALSVAVGPELMFSSADLRSRPVLNRDQKINVDGYAVGGQLGLHYIFNDQWSAGFTYHTSQEHKDHGRVEFQEQAGVLQNGNIAMSLTLPASYTLGLAFKPDSKWKLEADAVFTQWQDYKKLIYSYQRLPGTPGSSGDVTKWKNWGNVWRFQLGGEYMAKDWLALRAGFVWDQDPIPQGHADYMLPSSDRKIYSTGFGITQGKYTYDFAVMYLRNNHRSIDPNGDIIGSTEFSNSQAFMAGFSIGYTF